METETTLFPVAEITTGPIPAYGMILMRLDYLTNMLQKPEEANPGRNYALTVHQAHSLVQQIQSALQKLESAGFQPPPGQRM